MVRNAVLTALVVAGTALSGAPSAHAQQSFAAGQSIAPAYEGWEQNEDGSYNLVFGYMNRTWEEMLDVPVGPANSIEPGGPDRGQPTHFLPRRNRFIFRIRVPADFGDKELIWTLTTNGQTERAYATLRRDYYINDLVVQANYGASGAAGATPESSANVAPSISVEGQSFRSVVAGEPLTLEAVITDDGLPTARRLAPTSPRLPGRITTDSATGLRMSWFVFRGSGSVTFDPPQVKVWEDTREGEESPWSPGWSTPEAPDDGRWGVRATFSEPGTYVLRALAHDGGLAVSDDVTVTVTP